MSSVRKSDFRTSKCQLNTLGKGRDASSGARNGVQIQYSSSTIKQLFYEREFKAPQAREYMKRPFPVLPTVINAGIRRCSQFSITMLERTNNLLEVQSHSVPTLYFGLN